VQRSREKDADVPSEPQRTRPNPGTSRSPNGRAERITDGRDMPLPAPALAILKRCRSQLSSAMCRRKRSHPALIKKKCIAFNVIQS